MPLHDWAELTGWEGVHLLWIAELLRHIKGQLPAGYRAYLGSGPALAIGSPQVRPDIAVRSHESQPMRPSIPPTPPAEPDVEVAVAQLEPAPSLYVERDNRLIAAVELVALVPGSPLPSLPLPLDIDHSVAVDLETTYTRAAADAYLV